MRPITSLFLTLVGLANWSQADPQGDSGRTADPKKDAAIARAREDLRKASIDPASKAVVVSKTLSGDSYFGTRPKNEHWDRGRKAVGNTSFYMVTFSEPRSAPGGVHQYFFDSGTHRLLWINRGK